MKKSVRSLIMCLASVLGVGAFATACGESSAFGDENEHVHTYSDDWTADAEGHFHDYTCDCTDIPEKEAHVDDNNDGVCDLCKFTDHEHTYAEGWTVDCTNHWHAADCGHIVAGVDLAEHVDENADGECDVCKYVIEDIHEHVYSPDWTSDGEYHWHAALCEHKDQVSGHEAHQLNEAGDCTVCKEHVKDVDLTSLEKVLAAAMANNYKIAYGDVIAVDTVYDGVGKQTVMNGKTNKVHFALGNGQSYIQYVSFDKDGVFNGVEEQWFEEQPNGEVYGVAKFYGEYELEPIMGAAQFLNGYNYIPGSILPSDSDDTTTLANTLMALYNQMKAGVRVSNATENYDPATGKYSFAYTYYSQNVTTSAGKFNSCELELYNVVVEFTVNEDMIIDAADFSVEVYRDYEADSDLEYDYDVSYDEAGNMIFTITEEPELKASANPSTYEYTVSQVAGERTFTTPYPRESLVPTSFDFYYVKQFEWTDENCTDMVIIEGAKIEDSITIQAGEYAKFWIGDVLPKTASSKFLVGDDFTFSFVNNDPNSTNRAWYMDAGSTDATLNGYSAYQQMLKLKIRDVGEYTVTLGFGNIQKTFTLIVEGEQEVIVPDDTASKIYVETTDTYAWEDVKTYTASASGTYTFNLPAGLGLWSENAAAPEMDFYDNPNGDSVSFDLAAGQKLTFNVGAKTKDLWEITVDFVAGEVEGGGDVGGDVVELTEKDLVIGNNSNNAADVKYVYTAETAGTLTIKYGGFVMGSNSSITYVVNDGTATTLEAGVMAELVLAAGDVVAVNVYANGGYATVVTTWTADESGDVGGDTSKYETVIVEGSNTLVFSADEVSSDTASRKATITADGKYKFAAGTLFIESVVDADGNTIAKNDDYTYTLTAGEYTVNFGMLSMFGVQADVEQTLNVTNEGAAEEEDPEVIEPVGSLNVDESNTVSVTDADIEAGKIYYSFFAYEAGCYEFTSNWLLATVLDADGNALTAVSYGVYELEEYTSYLVEIGTSWVSAAGDYEVTVAYQYPEGHQNNPIQIAVGETTAHYKGDWTPVWHYFVATEDGTITVTAADTTATLLVSLMAGNEIESVDGVVTLDVIAGNSYNIGAANFNAGEADVVFTLAFEAGEITRDGTPNVPYEIVEGENTANTTEDSWGTAYYAYTAEKAGTLTLTAGNNTTIYVTAPEYVGAEEGVIVLSVAEGDSFVLCVGTADYTATPVTFTASFKGEAEGVATELVVGENTVAIEDNTYVTAEVYGLSGDYMISWTATGITVEVDGMTVENGGTFYSMNPMWSVYFRIYGENFAAVSEFTLTIEAVVIPATVITLGDNTVSVTDTFNGTNVEFTATAAGTYTFTAGTNAVLGYDYSNYLAGESFSVELAEGGVVAFVVLTEDYSEGDVVVTVSDGSAQEPEVPAGPTGTSADPFVVETLPYTVTFESTHDVYYTYTATEDCTLYFECPTGCLISELGVTKDDLGNYSVQVTAGQTIRFNPWSNGGTAPYTYTISKVEVQTPDPEQPGEGGEEGGEEGGVVKLVSDAAANGKIITLTIDEANATMTITRTNSDGSSPSTAVYSYTFDDAGNFTGVKQSGNICTFVWDGKIPTTVTWNGMAFTNFK